MRISAIVPSFKQGKYISDCLYSLISQGVPIELLVLDGGSSDETLEILKRYRKHLAWFRSEPDGGQAQAVNEGVGRSTGEIVCWLNSDDLLVEGTLKEVSNIFLGNPEIEMVIGSAFWASEDLQDISFWASPLRLDLEDFSYGIPILAQPSVFLRRSAWERVGRLDESLHFSLDYEFFIRCLREGVKAKIVDRPLSINRVQPNAKSLDPRLRSALHLTAQKFFKNAPAKPSDRMIKSFGLSILKLFPFSFLVGMAYRKIVRSPAGLPGGLVPGKWRDLAEMTKSCPERRRVFEARL